MKERRVFVSGATGYVGSRLIPELLRRGHRVRALIRTGSNKPLPEACEVVAGDALRSETFARAVPPIPSFIWWAYLVPPLGRACNFELSIFHPFGPPSRRLRRQRFDIWYMSASRSRRR